MRPPETNDADAEVIAIRALGWTLAEPARAERLLALTGLDAETLRRGIDDPALLAAVVDFLGGHEPDLVACADALGIAPEALAGTAARLRR